MSRLILPRGHRHQESAPLATATWAVPEEIADFSYEPGHIWLGLLPCPSSEAWETIERLQRQQQAVAANPNIAEDRAAEAIDRLQDQIETLNNTDAIDIGIDDDRHMVTVAGTRGGKGTTLIVPNLVRYPGSVICIDPKGENARLTAGARADSLSANGLDQKVFVLDPYGTSGLPAEQKASWNPLDLLSNDDPLVIDNAASVADALVLRSNAENAHFDDNARSFIKALILYVALKHEGRPTRNLVTVYDLLMRGAWAQLAKDRGRPSSSDDPHPFDYLLCLMQREDAFNGVIAGAAITIQAMGDRERGAVLSTARRNLEFLERTPMRDVLLHSSFDLDWVKTDPQGVSLYLCLPPARMADCGRWLRLVTRSCLERHYDIETETATGLPTLFLLEEFASLGHMEIIEQAAGYAAGFGVKLWVIIQDLGQLKRHYKEGWETFLGNAGVVQAFANSDLATLEYLSKRLGETEVLQSVKNVSSSLAATSNDPGLQHRIHALLQNRGQASLVTNPLTLLADPASAGQSATTTESWNQQIQRCPLLLPDEIERAFARERFTEMVLVKGKAPMILNRTRRTTNPDS